MRVRAPTGNDVVVKTASPEGLTTTLSSSRLSAKNLTSPTAVGPSADPTAAVSVTACPVVDATGETLNVVVDALFSTVCGQTLELAESQPLPTVGL